MSFHANQVETGDKIVEEFNREIRQVCLVANLQSGKTGTFQYVIRKMLSMDLVKNAIIICGMNDNDLKNQAIEDAKYYNREYQGMIKVAFNRDLSRIRGLKDTLVVLDESHYGSTLEQNVDKFLRRNGICVDGNEFKMEENNNYILTVSATPFAEMSDLLRNKNQHKESVFLKSGVGYLGIRDFYEAEKIKTIFDIKENRRMFMDMLQENKYYIGRIDKRVIDENELKLLCDEAGARLVVFAQTSNMESFMTKLTEINEMMRIVPVCPTLILIKGKLRAGCVLTNKQHIGWIWENSKAPNTDTVMQGLMGRCCGYNSNIGIEMYVSPRLFEGEKNEIQAYIDMLNEERIIPRYGNHIVPHRQKKTDDDEEFKYSRPTIAFDMKNEMRERILCGNMKLSSEFQRLLIQRFKQYIQRQRENVALNDEFFEYVLEHLNNYLENNRDNNFTFRSYCKNQYTGDESASVIKFINSYTENVPYCGNQGNTKKGNKFLTVAVVYPDYIHAPEDARGNVYYVLRTPFASNILLPVTKQTEIFYPRIHEEGEIGRIKGVKKTQDMRDKTSEEFMRFINTRFQIIGCPNETQPYDDTMIYYIVKGTTHQDAVIANFKERGFKIEFKYKRGRRDRCLEANDKVIARILISRVRR